MWFERTAALGAARGNYMCAIEELVALDLDDGDLPAARRHLDTAWLVGPPDDQRRAALHGLEYKLALLLRQGAKALHHIEQAFALQPRADFVVARVLNLVWLGQLEEARAVAATVNRTAVTADTLSILSFLDSVVAPSLARDSLDEWARSHGADQRGWLLLALHAHLTGEPAAACLSLTVGRDQARPRTLLWPAWAPAACAETGLPVGEPR
jgi:hypothetical protein